MTPAKLRQKQGNFIALIIAIVLLITLLIIYL
jgi:hypothetical protein